MNSKYLLWGAVAFIGLALSSCQEKEYDYVDQPDEPEFYATIEQAAPETKVYADAKLRVLWHADDRVSIFNKYTYNNQYAFQGETGDNSGVFKKVPNDDFVTGNALDYIYAVYPYQDGTRIDNDGFISLTLPSVQPYAELNFGIGANTMVSVTEDNDLLFKNLCGYIAVKLYGDGVSVSGITLKGNGGEKLAGNAVVTAPLDGAPSVAMADDASGEITLRCASSVALGATANESTEFWFVLPPTAFTQGFTITVRDSNGRTFEKTTDKSVTIERNHLSRMSPFEVEIERQPDNEIWYTSKDGNVVSPYQYATDPFGANLVSNTYENGKGVLLFDGPVTRIGSDAFAYGRKLTSISLPSSVMELGEHNPFYACSGLESFSGKFASPDGHCLIQGSRLVSFASSGMTAFTIPDGVTEIGNEAFDESVSLVSVVIPDGVTRIGRSAFSYCYCLKSIEIPDSVTELGDTPFYSCGALESFSGKFASADGRCLVKDGAMLAFAPYGITEYSIPEEVTGIGHAAFAYYPVTSVVVHANVTSIEWEAFYYCSRLESITVAATVPPVGGSRMLDNTNDCPIYVPAQSLDAYKAADHWRYYADRILPMGPVQPDNEIWYTTRNGVILTPYRDDFGVNIVSNTYEDGKGIIRFDGSVSKIGYSAFKEQEYDCILVSMQLPSSVKTIESGAFNTCYSLESINLPDGLETLGSSAFFGCKALVSIEIPDSVTTIGDSIFQACSRLSQIKSRFSSADERCFIVDGELNSFAYAGITDEYEFPDELVSIGESAMRNCWFTGTILCGKNIKTIGGDAFAYSRMNAIELSEGLESVGPGAFRYCGITSLTLPSTLQQVGQGAFINKFDSIVFLSVVPPAVSGGSLFADEFPIYVPATSVDAYKAAQYWSDYADRIQAINGQAVPEAVDLGLSVKWASFNLGASAPEEYGDYFAWGETETKDYYDWSTYNWCNGNYNNLTKYNTSSSFGTVDNKTVLDPEDDVAHVVLGGNWRMPTDAEWTELRTQCTWTWTTQNGVKGRKVTGPNGNSVFLPAAGGRYGTDLGNAGSYGCYWSSFLNTFFPSRAWYVLFHSGNVDWTNDYRYYGRSVRPVKE